MEHERANNGRSTEETGRTSSEENATLEIISIYLAEAMVRSIRFPSSFID